MSTDGKTFEDILSENLAHFGWNIPASQIPEYETARRLFQQIFDWANGVDEQTWKIVDEVNLAPGLKKAGYFTEWPEMSVIFDGPSYGTNSATVANFVTCFNNAFERQFQPA